MVTRSAFDHEIFEKNALPSPDGIRWLAVRKCSHPPTARSRTLRVLETKIYMRLSVRSFFLSSVHLQIDLNKMHHLHLFCFPRALIIIMDEAKIAEMSSAIRDWRVDEVSDMLDSDAQVVLKKNAN